MNFTFNEGSKRSMKFVVPFAVIFLAGCANSKQYKLSEPDPGVVRLNEVAESIQKHSNDLADIEAAQYMDQTGKKLPSTDTRYVSTLNNPISLGDDWNGSLFKLVQTIAGLSGYEVRTLNVEPPGGVIVNVPGEYRRMVDILRDAGTQAGSRAKVVVKAKEKVIEIEYVTY